MLGFERLTNFKVFQVLSNTPNIFNYAPIRLDWLQSLKQFFINVSYYILVASLHLMALIFISGCGSAISSAKEGKSGFIYKLVRS